MKTPCFIYHGFVGSRERRHLARFPEAEARYSLPIEQFQNHLDFLAQEGFEACSVADYLATKLEGKKRVILTLDDGHASNYDLAWPLLQERGFRASFFIVAGWVGRPDRMSRAQLREVANSGMSIGSHGLTHAPLSRLSREQLDQELVRSKKTLEDMLGLPIRHLAIPGGFSSPQVLERARAAGYESVCTSVPGLAEPEFVLRRLSVTRLTDLPSFAALAGGNTVQLAKSRAVYEVIEGVKWVLGVRNYERLAQRVLRDRLPRLTGRA